MKLSEAMIKVGDKVMITHCDGEIIQITHFSVGRGYMLTVKVGDSAIPCYREEVRKS